MLRELLQPIGLAAIAAAGTLYGPRRQIGYLPRPKTRMLLLAAQNTDVALLGPYSSRYINWWPV